MSRNKIYKHLTSTNVFKTQDKKKQFQKNNNGNKNRKSKN